MCFFRFLFFGFSILVSVNLLGNSCASHPKLSGEFQKFEKLINENYLPNYLSKCKRANPELATFIEKVEKDLVNKPISFACGKLKNTVGAQVLKGKREIEWNLEWLKEEGVIPVKEKREMSKAVVNTYFHEILHHFDIESTTRYKHNNRNVKVFGTKKRHGKILVPDNHVDSIYLISSACTLAQDKSIFSSDALSNNYIYNFNEIEKTKLKTLCVESMKQVNKKRNVFESHQSLVDFCSNYNSKMADKALAVTINFRFRLPGAGVELHKEANECGASEDPVDCLLNSKSADQVLMFKETKAKDIGPRIFKKPGSR